MKLISFNVNGLRACMEKGFKDFFLAEDADIVCLQEIKMLPEQADFRFEGYYDYWNSAQKKGYSGTLVYTKQKPLSASYAFCDEYSEEGRDTEGRVVILEYEGFTLVNVYTPNSKDGLARLDYRMTWQDNFKNFLEKRQKEKPLIICGDLNVAHEEIDLKNPKTNRRNAGFTDEERGKMTELLDIGLIDSFRSLYPERQAYTWWSYRFSARAKDVGWRIDYFLVSESLRDKIKDAVIYKDVHGSDHCPVGLDIEI